MKATSFSLAAAALVLSGCAATLSGVGGTDGYACKAPQGVMCTSVSGVYANSRQDVTAPSDPKSATPPASYVARAIAPASTVKVPGTSLRSNPRVLRLWIAPWEDADGDLHEEALVHVVVDPGRWLIEHVRPVTRARLDAVSPPIAPAHDNVGAKPSNDSAIAPTQFPTPPGGLPSGLVPGTTER